VLVDKSIMVGKFIEETIICFWLSDKIIIELYNISTGKVKLTSRLVGIVGTTTLLTIEIVGNSYGVS